MRKITSLTFLILFTATVFAQNQKGDFEIYLQVAPFITVNPSKDLGLISIAGIEYFADDKISLATNFYTSNNTFIKNDSGITIQSYGLMTTGQYYFFNFEKWNTYAQAGLGFGIEDTKLSNVDNSALFIWNLGAGANYRLSEKISLKLLIPYFNAENSTRKLTAANGITVFLGMGYRF